MAWVERKQGVVSARVVRMCLYILQCILAVRLRAYSFMCICACAVCVFLFCLGVYVCASSFECETWRWFPSNEAWMNRGGEYERQTDQINRKIQGERKVFHMLLGS
jgi:hypothetical protein